MTIDLQCLVGDRQLQLNGVGVRKVMMFNVYKAYLYTATRLSSPEPLYGFEAPTRILFEYLYGPISKDRIADAWSTALVKAARASDIAQPLARFIATMSDYAKGDVVYYDLTPDHRIHVVKNGKELDSIASKELCLAVLDVLFGAEPIDAKLKDGMLGNA